MKFVEFPEPLYFQEKPFQPIRLLQNKSLKYEWTIRTYALRVFLKIRVVGAPQWVKEHISSGLVLFYISIKKVSYYKIKALYMNKRYTLITYAF